MHQPVHLFLFLRSVGDTRHPSQVDAGDGQQLSAVRHARVLGAAAVESDDPAVARELYPQAMLPILAHDHLEFFGWGPARRAVVRLLFWLVQLRDMHDDLAQAGVVGFAQPLDRRRLGAPRLLGFLQRGSHLIERKREGGSLSRAGRCRCCCGC